MKHVTDLFWILLLNGIYVLNLTDKSNANETSSTVSLNVPTERSNCDPTANGTTKRSPDTRVEITNISCLLKVTENREETIDWEVRLKIKFYNNLAKWIWKISPPIFIGKN